MTRQSGRSATFAHLLRCLAVAAAAAVLTVAAMGPGNALSATALHATDATDATAAPGWSPVVSAALFLRPRFADGDEAPGGMQPDGPSDNPGSSGGGTTSARTMDDLKKDGWTCMWNPNSGGYWDCTKPGEKPWVCSAPDSCGPAPLVRSHFDDNPRPTQAV
jgi:hypothetical protein